MILFLTILWIIGVVVANKIGWIKMNLWWKLSPVFWSLFLLLALIVPLQFWAPSGSFVMGNYTVPIVPQVAGEVKEIHVVANTPVKKGDPLFTIEQTRFKTSLDNANAGLRLAEIRLDQEQQLQARGVGKPLDLNRAQAQVEQKRAQYERAAFDLQSTEVVAPSDGYVTNLTIRPGVRAVTLPLSPVMTFVDTSEQIFGGFVLQNHLRYVESGQKVEVALKMYPGQVFEAEVEYVVPARATGFETRNGMAVAPQPIVHAPFAVRIKASPEMQALDLPAGASGQMTIYSGQGAFVHIIRKVEIRIEAILNFINPF